MYYIKHKTNEYKKKKKKASTEIFYQANQNR